MFDLTCAFTPNKVNATPLNAACGIGHHDVVQTLLGAGADVNIATSDVSYAMFHNITTCRHRLWL